MNKLSTISTVLLLSSTNAFAWGELGHRIVAEYGSSLAQAKSWQNCHITAAQIVSHTNDPDRIWRTQRLQHPKEGLVHFMHIDKQPTDWRSRSTAKDQSQGLLAYRIADWIKLAREQRQKQNWSGLAETLYGLSHYLGDLAQPLHLYHDHDGVEAGITGVHSQYETKMLNRFEPDLRRSVEASLKNEGIPSLWTSRKGDTGLRELVFDVAVQSSAKAPKLLSQAKSATVAQKARQSKHKRPNSESLRFEKKRLWQATRDLTVEQLSLGARLWAHVLNDVCSN